MKLSVRTFPVPNRWCLHSYYSLCPYAPDGSGRILASGVDQDAGVGEVLVLSAEGDVLQRFGNLPPSSSFWHTGFWQSWSPNAESVYFQSGSFDTAQVTRRDLATHREESMPGDVEGFPPSGEPAFACSHGMLYAAGYGDGRYKPEASPIPFQARDSHGIFRLSLRPPSHTMLLTTGQILDRHPQRDRIRRADREIAERLGPGEGLTLMTYCVRWNRAGTRCLFFFGNHRVARERGEPKITTIFTADRNLENIRPVVDLSFGRRGVHWAWQGDGEHLIGYGPHPDRSDRLCLAEVRHDGTGYRMVSEHHSGGHPSTSPVDPDLIVTDEPIPGKGAVVFLSKKTGGEVGRVELAKYHGTSEPPGRNPHRVCHHPVFNHVGDRVLCNSLPGRNAVLTEIHLAP